MGGTIVRTMGGLQRIAGDIAELTLGATDHQAFRERLLDCLDRAVGFDLASVHHARAPGDGAMCTRGYDPVQVETRILDYMMELEPHELVAAESERPMIDIDVIPLARRERLSLYREQLRPNGVSVFTTVMWRNRHGGFGFHLARSGRGRKFTRRELGCLEVLVPSIKLAEAYFCARAPLTPTSPRGFDRFAEAIRLSKGERQVASLAIRGFQNREIAHLLGVSPLTVRNQLGSVFRKADVSTRAELAFVSASDESAWGDVRRGRGQRTLRWDDFFGRRFG